MLWAGDAEGLRKWAAELGAWAPAATGTLMVVQALAAPIPAVVVTATNSILFGPFWGGWLSILSATVAAWICFALARLYGEPVVRKLVSARALAHANGFLERHGAAAVLGARLVPIVPFDPISYLAGLSRMSAWTFFWATFAGQVPAGMAYSYVAQEWRHPERLAILAGAAFLTLLAAGFALRRLLLRRSHASRAARAAAPDPAARGASDSPRSVR